MSLLSHDIDIMTFFTNTFNHTMNRGWVFFLSHDVFLRKQGFYVGPDVWAMDMYESSLEQIFDNPRLHRTTWLREIEAKQIAEWLNNQFAKASHIDFYGARFRVSLNEANNIELYDMMTCDKVVI